MCDHADDVAAAGGRSRFEYHTDCDTIDCSGNQGVQEIVRHKEAVGVLNLDQCLHEVGVAAGNVGKDTVVYQRVITPCGFQNHGGAKDQDCAEDGLQTELRPQNPGAYQQQRDVHADGVKTDTPRPYCVQYVGQTVCSSRCQPVRVDKHHIPDREQHASNKYQKV